MIFMKGSGAMHSYSANREQARLVKAMDCLQRELLVVMVFLKLEISE